MRVFPSDRFELPLPAGHSFPLTKYRRLRERLEAAVASGAALSFHQPQAASWESLARVHDAGYLERVFRGTLSVAEVRRIGFPWSEQLVERSRRSTGAAIDASRVALAEGIANDAKKKANVTPWGTEGEPASGWVLMDYGDLIVHLFSPEMRSYYSLEELWSDSHIVLRMQ